jgi:hypothetical protein
LLAASPDLDFPVTATASRERKTAFAGHEVKEFRDPLKVQMMKEALPNGHDEGRGKNHWTGPIGKVARR